MDGTTSLRGAKRAVEKNQSGVKLSQATATSSFNDLVRQNLHPSEGLVNEEDLFASLIDAQLRTNFSDEAADLFQSKMAEFVGNDLTTEKAANRALKKVRVEGNIDRGEAHDIRNRAFGAAQLDDNTSQLFADRNGRIARGAVDEAVESSVDQLSLYESGAESPTTGPQRRAILRDLRITSGEIDPENKVNKKGEKKKNKEVVA